MKYRKLGQSNLSVREISFGCMSLGKDQQENTRLIREAFERGINFFDTADLYDRGWNETSVGRAVKDFRREIVLATKVGNQWRADGSGWDWNPRKDYILQAVDQSLQRLQTDYIDLYQLHGGTIDDPIDETIEAFERLVEQGKIRYYGISSIRPNTIREYIDRSNVVSVMMQYSLLDRRPEESCLDLLQAAGISVITRGTLAKGLLIDKAARDYLDYNKEEIKHLQKQLIDPGKATTTALHYVLQHPAVASAVVGMRTPQQLKEVIAGYGRNCTLAELEAISKVLPPNVYEKHR
ncbi:aldo/keto reductase [Flavilitoribacter nigricans]|uniref:Oxidoreductase n=1 Tax=Flavilitoribacter nigricans (strain ATCC 23147 / DSM 23189 / NBRC 102662 / NCIMB 1420 / SS-2) TaxID=1122177 RepID=A0A2D0N839_FLAN2|nr:aldo/keto reductase [Flavilitoribacter nigricans]PHN04681.1 oxidoreductase [Flavilitoribacter nigricans DSM 23189 = NBRC 102662]